LDEDVTGGGNWACSRAVFVHECRDPQLGKPLFGCLGKTAVACSERDAMNQRLGPLVPVEALDAGEIRFHGDGGSMTCFLRLDRSLACD
jgi:hypothetical protein